MCVEPLSHKGPNSFEILVFDIFTVFCCNCLRKCVLVLVKSCIYYSVLVINKANYTNPAVRTNIYIFIHIIFIYLFYCVKRLIKSTIKIHYSQSIISFVPEVLHAIFFPLSYCFFLINILDKLLFDNRFCLVMTVRKF